jgi:hypothetical protein
MATKRTIPATPEEIAETAKPGWRAVRVASTRAAANDRNSPALKPDAFSPDLQTLQSKSHGDGTVRYAGSTGSDELHLPDPTPQSALVAMIPKNGTSQAEVAVLVVAGRVVAEQG